MSTTMNTASTDAPSAAGRRSLPRNAWLALGGIALALSGMAAGLAWRPGPQAAAAPQSVQGVAPTANDANSAAASQEPAARDGTPAPHATSKVPAASSRSAQRAPATPAQAYAGNGAAPLPTQHVAVCAHCGVVEGVREVSVKGEGTGLGAVAGGVVGAAVGNQVGRGNGRTVMTVLGAVGGGLAGNEIEKRARAQTVYEVRVRMDDGRVRTLQQKTAPTPGARVVVEGNTLRAARASEGSGGEAQMMRTSSSGT